MPRTTSIREQSSLHLSIILGVAPDLDEKCVGFATSQNRRCKLQASNKCGRTQACRILDEGTRLLSSGENIDEILKDLAPLLLCNRWHQNQAGQLVYEWSNKVEKFHERRRASAGFLLRSPSPAPRRNSERARMHRPVGYAADRGSPASRASVDGISSIEQEDDIRQTTTSAPLRFDDTEEVDTSSNINSAITEAMDRSRIPTESMPTSQQANSELARSTQAGSEAETRTTSTSTESARPARNPARRQTSRSGVITRRHVEGECNICFLPLQEDESDADEQYERNHLSDHDEESSEDSRDDHEGHEGHEELVWCKRQCGNNFHRDCMVSWINTFARRFENNGRQPTCPICRANWVQEQ